MSATAAVVLTAHDARAQTCALGPVSAKGEQASYDWLARTKARGNWRSKVRRTAGLGAAYANWSRAINTDEYCLKGPLGTVCTATGTPCK